eukprot:TRINITY_DN12889_c0_g1_i1.p1 TRINITY_DN12889_c0_g1~~TRINITY_DN12889_c0_g1_i1.p1  ORF type:complete len:119 (-),score=14.73 TRINITY_DN12889_c0_g1_i1:270-626(-)
MREELEREESALVVQFEGIRQERDLQDLEAIAQYERGDSLPCPICSEQLEMVRDSLFCHCGLVLEGVGFSSLQHQLAELMELHRRQCHQAPFFCMETKFGMDGLYMLCNHCDVLEIVM